MNFQHSQLQVPQLRGPRLIARAGEYLSDDQIRAVAPSVFATEAHGSRSERFSPIPTGDVLAGLRKEGFQVMQVAQQRTRTPDRIDFTKHMVRLRRIDAKADRKIGDVYPEAVLLNANDGSSSYCLSAGLFRLICLNGMVVAERAANSVRVTHMGDVVSKVIEGTFTVLEDSQKAIAHAGEWSAIDLTPRERGAFAEAARVVRFGDHDGNVVTPITADQLLRPRRLADNGDNLWQTFNRVQENVIRGGLSGIERTETGTRRVKTREINGIDQDMRLNRALWLLAETLADRKAA